MGGNKIADNAGPRLHHIVLVEPLAQAELLYQRGQQFSGCFPAIRPRFGFGQAAPFGDHGVAEGCRHSKDVTRATSVTKSKPLTSMFSERVDIVPGGTRCSLLYQS